MLQALNTLIDGAQRHANLKESTVHAGVVLDDRNVLQQHTHVTLITAYDKCMSGWGGAEGGASYAAWAVKPEHEAKVLAWVKGRSDMQRVKVNKSGWRPASFAHLSIYVVNDNHASLRSRP